MRHLTIAALVALALLPAGTAEGEWLQKSKNDLYNTAYRAQLQRFRDLRTELKRLNVRHIRWGKEKRPYRKHMITIEPGYPTSTRKEVEVEWFFTYLGGSGRINPIEPRTFVGASSLLEPLVLEWMKSLDRGTKGRVRVKWSPVSSIKGRSRQLNDQNEIYQSIAFSGEAIGKTSVVRRELRKRSSSAAAISMRLPSETERFIKKIGLPVAEFREAAASDEVRRRMRETTAKLAALVARVEAVNPDAIEDPVDPIFLINGKYLVQGSLAGGARNTFRMANWLIRRELEKRTR